MEKDEKFISFNKKGFDPCKAAFIGSFCAGLFSMFGFMQAGLAAFCICLVLGLIAEAVKKPFGYIPALLTAAAAGTAGKEEFLTGLKAFSNAISEFCGKTYGRVIPMFEGIEADRKDKLIMAAVVSSAAVILAGLILDIAGRGAALAGTASVLIVISVLKAELNPWSNIWIIITFAAGAVLAGRKNGTFRTVISLVLTGILVFGGISLIGDMDFEEHGKALSLEKSDQVALTVAMEKPQSMYLKGETFDIYKDGLWSDFKGEKLYESRDLFFWLHEEGFFGQSQLAKAALTFDEALKDEENKVTVDIKNADDSVRYVPYELADGKLADKGSIGDGEIVRSFNGKKTYSFTALPNQIKSYSKILADITLENAKLTDGKKMSSKAKKYLNEESYYNNYIYTNYTALGEEYRGLFEEMLGKYKLDGKSHYDYLSAKEKIVGFLTNHITYDEEASYKGDFIDEFLSISCKGCSVHYASAGVLMMRYYGIPARLASGYLVTPDDQKKMKAADPYNITEENRHYWVEYYQDGVGWIPFEVTTPYMGIMESENHLASVSRKPETEPEEKHEMTQNNYKKPEKEKTPKEHRGLNGAQAALIALFAVLLIAGILAALYFMRRKKIFDERYRQGYMSEDISRRSVFDYMLLREICSKYGETLKNRDAYRIYQKARYSEKGIEEKDFESLNGSISERKALIYAKLTVLQKMAWRYWRFY